MNFEEAFARYKDGIATEEEKATEVEMPKNDEAPLQQFWKWLTGQS